VESLFNTKVAEFHHYTDMEKKQTKFIAGDITLPTHVEKAIHAVYGVHGLPLPAKKTITAGTPPAVTPAVINKAYDIGEVKPTGSVKARSAVAEFQGQLMDTDDLVTFFKDNNLDPKDGVVYKFHGGQASGYGIEAQLDIQFIMGVAPGVKTDFYEQMNSDFCADLKNWTGILLSDADVPLVHSVSYGWQGNLTQIGCTDAEVQDVDADFQKLAAKGITIIFASGDSGSGWAPPRPTPCSQTSPGTKGEVLVGKTLRTFSFSKTQPNAEFTCCMIARQEGPTMNYQGWTFTAGATTDQCAIIGDIKSKKQGVSGAMSGLAPSGPTDASPLWPSWPASSPWVTSVGATRFHNDVVDGEEAAVGEEDHFGSGGGFSAQFPVADWQKKVVDEFIANPSAGLPDPSKCSWAKGGRGTPDVSALGTGFAVVNQGQPLPGGVGGTSASAPTFAAMIGLINDERIKAGKSALGFLNPMIYQNMDAFTDITIGSDRIARGGGPLPYGFNVTKGWDPVTGVGTPVYSKLKEAAMAL
jgi:subtilase family serine protease